MNKFRLTIQMLAIAIFTFAFASMAQAQATRTWVSGVGDDANPCSRTAPCKTFAGAISKTAANGEIDCLDPGGFGTVTITKSITIDGTHGGGFGSILAAGTNGVNVNDSGSGSPNTIIVRLHSLSINGAGTGFTGINFTSGKALHVEDCQIFGFRGNGTSSHGISVNVNGTAAQQLFVSNTTIEDNTGSGINTTATAFGVTVVVDNCYVNRNQNGINAATNTNMQVSNSHLDQNVGVGISVALVTSANIDSCFMLSNLSAGILSTNVSGTVRISNNTILGSTSGVQCSGGNSPNSYGENKINGNGNNNNGCTNPLPVATKS